MPEYLKLFTKELFEYIENYGVGAVLAGILSGGICLCAALIKKRYTDRKAGLAKTGMARGAILRCSVIAALFGSYAFLLLAITIFSREPGSISVVNLKPFDTFNYKRFTIENVLLFIPFGFFYGIAAKGRARHFYLAGLTGMIASVLIETAQFLSARGGTEIDDVLTNTFGMILGYAFAALVRYAWS